MSFESRRPLAPELQTVRWFNTDHPLTLAGLRGKIVLLHAFQMLCPGCVMSAIPQAQRLDELAKHLGVVTIGLHTVFEHHAVMTPDALDAFLHEYRITFAVAVDEPASLGVLPKTMAAYQMQGTPTMVVIGRDGCVAQQIFGIQDDLDLGLRLGQLLALPEINYAQARHSA